jgi:hypothetical protein
VIQDSRSRHELSAADTPGDKCPASACPVWSHNCTRSARVRTCCKGCPNPRNSQDSSFPKSWRSSAGSRVPNNVTTCLLRASLPLKPGAVITPRPLCKAAPQIEPLTRILLPTSAVYRSKAPQHRLRPHLPTGSGRPRNIAHRKCDTRPPPGETGVTPFGIPVPAWARPKSRQCGALSAPLPVLTCQDHRYPQASAFLR